MPNIFDKFTKISITLVNQSIKVDCYTDAEYDFYQCVIIITINCLRLSYLE